MDDNVHLKAGKLFRIKPKDSLDKLSYRLSMSLKQPDDNNYIVDELFHNENVTIYALYDVDHKLDLTSRGNNERVGDGMNLLDNGFNRVQSTFLLENSNLKRIKATSKHTEGEKVDQDIQTDLDCSDSDEKKFKKPAELKMLYCRQLRDKERKHRGNRLKTKGICSEVNGALNVNAIIKKDSCTVVQPRENLNLKVESRRNSSIYYSSSSSNKEAERIKKKGRRFSDFKEGLDMVSESSETEPIVNFSRKEIIGPKKNVRINAVPYEVPDSRESSACFSLKGFRSSLVSINEGKELQLSRTYPDEQTNLQHAILEDMRCLQYQLNLIVSRLENQLFTSRLFLPNRRYSTKAVSTKESAQSHQLISSRLLLPDRQYSSKAVNTKESVYSHRSEPVRSKIRNYDDIPVFSCFHAIPAEKECPASHNREITVHVAMKKCRSSTAVFLNGNSISISEEDKTCEQTIKCDNSLSDISIRILSRCKRLGASKSDSGSIRASIGSTTSLRKSLSYDHQGSAKLKSEEEEKHVEKIMASSVFAIMYSFTHKVLILESFASYEIILGLDEDILDKPVKDTTTHTITSIPNKKTRKIPIWKYSPDKKRLIDVPRPNSPQKSVAQRNNSRLPWNGSLQKNNAELLRKNLIAKTKAPDSSTKKEDNIKSRSSLHSESNRKSINAMKKFSADSAPTPGMKVIHSNRSYLDVMKNTEKELESERSKKHVTPHACINVSKDKKTIGQAAKQNMKANGNYIIFPQTVYEKVIYVRDSNMKDEDSSSEIEESLLGKEPSYFNVRKSKSEESQVVKNSKERLVLTGKQSLPEIGNHKDGLFVSDVGQRCSDGKIRKNMQVVRSIWALTKVLIFDDGTKKVEVLEASCAPGSSNPDEKNKT